MNALYAATQPFLLDPSDVTGLPRRVGYQPGLDEPCDDPQVSFIERKQVDWTRVRKVLALSEKSNHWANFGPVTAALEGFLAHLLGLPENRCVVMCSSATTALFSVVGLNELKLGRPLRVVASAYGFFSSNIGPLEGVQLIDSDEQGMLDVDALAELDEDSYDAVLVTNLFGLHPDPEPYRGFCRAHGKILILDGATAIGGVDRSAADGEDEVISFHHTKPWGVGEGGCAIVAREDADKIRSFINFGVGLPRTVARWATNGKISDYASALILDRLERLPVWSSHYRAQHERFGQLASSLGIARLRGANVEVISAHLGLLADAPFGMDRVSALPVPCRKYYRPLGEGSFPKAQHLYARMVNVPTHSGMDAVADDTAIAALSALLGR